MEDEKAPMSTNCCWSYLEETDAKVGSTIKVIGYPGKYNGKLYYMDGTIDKIIWSDNRHNAIISYKDITTTEG
jgi:hypothetical protein